LNYLPIDNYVQVNTDINLQNNFNSTAITNPTIINGICHGSSDGASYSSFNLGIASWYGIGFIDSCYRKCVIYFDVRGGHINYTGTHTCNNIVCNSTGNIIISGSYNLTQTQLSYLSIISSDVQNQLNTINICWILILFLPMSYINPSGAKNTYVENKKHHQ
jgi:hypothetical protein